MLKYIFLFIGVLLQIVVILSLFLWTIGITAKAFILCFLSYAYADYLKRKEEKMTNAKGYE